MRILGIIPARSGSKGVPGKNTRLLGDKPLIAYTIESALLANGLSDVIVSTDCENIAEIAKEFGASVPFIRPAEFARDTSKSIDVVLHALDKMNEMGKLYDAVLLLQPTNPFRPVGFIDKCINKFNESEFDSLISVLPVPHEYNPHWVFKSDIKECLKIATGESDIIPRRQDLPSAYYRDGSVYITKSSVLQNKNSFFGDKLGFVEANIQTHVNIDTLKDWELAEYKLKNHVWN